MLVTIRTYEIKALNTAHSQPFNGSGKTFFPKASFVLAGPEHCRVLTKGNKWMLHLELKNTTLFHLLELFRCFPSCCVALFLQYGEKKLVVWLSELLASAWQFQQFRTGTHPSVRILFLFPLLRQQGGWDPAPELICILPITQLRQHMAMWNTWIYFSSLKLNSKKKKKNKKRKTPGYVLCYRSSQFLFLLGKSNTILA